MNNIRNIAIFLLFAMMVFFACEEAERYAISPDDKTPPAAPRFDSLQALPGGVRLFYKIPADEDVISIEASFTATNGKLVKSAVSFVAPYLEVFGLPDSLEHTVELYALDRAGNRSVNADVPPFHPLKPAYQKVAETLEVKPSFGAILIRWKNELRQNINVFVDFTYSDNGTIRSLQQVYSSRNTDELKFIKKLQGAVSVKVNVEDLYGNRSGFVDKGNLQLLVDEELDKTTFSFPTAGTSIGGKVMSYGDCGGGKIVALIDGHIDYLPPIGLMDNYAYFHIWNVPAGVNVWPMHCIIDLHKKYELSRIVTNQMWDHQNPATAQLSDRANFYGGLGTAIDHNVKTYNMYYWDGDDAAIVGEWKLINQVIIPTPPSEMGTIDIIHQALLGDEAVMYPDNPRYTPATRYFMYEPIASFHRIYGGDSAWGLSELTLYGREATR